MVCIYMQCWSIGQNWYPEDEDEGFKGYFFPEMEYDIVNYVFISV